MMVLSKVTRPPSFRCLRRNASSMAVALWIRQRRWGRTNGVDRVDLGNVIGMQGVVNDVCRWHTHLEARRRLR